MKWSETFLFTQKEAPADAEIISHQLFVRAGLIRKVAPGIFTYGTLGLRTIRKFEQIIREELEKVKSQEVLMPMVHPRSLWDESGRWPFMTELLKFKNKNDQDFCLGATHEEVICDYVRGDLKSYRDLPVSIFQIQTKYRDEIRPRLGLMRGREFIMKDAYTFDESKEKALESYEQMKIAYRNIFKRLGLEFCMVEADSGAIGGNHSHEFQVIADSGMDHLFRCQSCDYASNEEITPVISPKVATEAAQTLEKFATPNLKTIADLAKSLDVKEQDLVKTFFVKFVHERMTKFFTVLVPGDKEVNLIKVKKAVDETVDAEVCCDEEVLQLTKARPGSCGPVGLEIPVILDTALEGKNNFIVGANEDGFHLKNVCPGRDFEARFTADVSLAKEGDPCPKCSKPLKATRGAEVGHIFYLGKKYSEPMNVKFLDQGGKSQVVEMGCYGIGVTRTVQAAIEQCHDKDGIVWPAPLSPFMVHFCLLDQSPQIVEHLNKLTQRLDEAGFDYFIDDREERPGVKFKDADLLGFPLRVTMGQRAFDQGMVEFTFRKSKDQQKIALDESMDFIEKSCRDLMVDSDGR